MTFAVRRPDQPYFVFFDAKKGVCFTRDQTKADFFADAQTAQEKWAEAVKSERARCVAELATVSYFDQFKKLAAHEQYHFHQVLKKIPEFAQTPLSVRFKGWITYDGPAPLFEVPDPEALSEQVTLFMARSGGKWIVSANNGEGLVLSDSCDKAPTFLSKAAALHYFKNKIHNPESIVFVEFAAFAKKADFANTQKTSKELDAFEQGLNARSEGREIRLSIEECVSTRLQEELPSKRKNTL